MNLFERYRYHKEIKHIELGLRPVSYDEDRNLARRSHARIRRAGQLIRGLISKARPDIFCGTAADPIVEQMLQEAQADAKAKQASNELVIESLSADRESRKQELDSLIQLIYSKIGEITDEIDAVRSESDMKGVNLHAQ